MRDFVSGHPDLIISFSYFNDGSLAVASLTSSSSGFETGRLDVSKWTCSAISSFMLPYVVSGSGALESMSGSTNSFPGLYSKV